MIPSSRIDRPTRILAALNTGVSKRHLPPAIGPPESTIVATAEDHESVEVAERADSRFAPESEVIARRRMLRVLPPGRMRDERPAVEIRAMAVWPRLDRRLIYRSHGDVERLARAIARHRTTLSVEDVIRILTGPDD